MSPESLDGLEEFSHVWLTFKFHLNTNTLKEAKAFNGVVGEGNSKRNYTFKAKIVPPMLKEKKGVLATRSPHRYSNCKHLYPTNVQYYNHNKIMYYLDRIPLE